MDQPGPAYEGDEPYVFVSYSHQDEALVYKEIQWLQDQGVNVWYDSRIQAGSEWSDAIADAISGCSRFLYLITPNSVASENCRRELNHAMAENRAILAVHLQETEVPGGIRLNLDNRQAILKYRLKPEDFHATLLGALSADVSGSGVHATVAEASSNRTLKLVSVIAATLVITASAAWLWQRIWLAPSPVESIVSTEAPLTAIAVLPFDDLSPDEDHAWLADGMAEDLIEALGRIDALHVPARRSTAILKQDQADLATIGQRLAVGSVVEGSVRRIGKDLSVLARWTRVSDGARLWSARYNRQVDDVFEIQNEIAVGIAEAIRIELGIQDARASLLGLRYKTSDLRAWELVKKAAALIEGFEPDEMAEARDMLLLAIDYDPDFMAAHVQLAWIDYLGNVERGIERFKAVLEMDPSNPDALGAFAWDSAMRFWDYESAERLLDRIPVAERTITNLEVEFHVKRNTRRLDEALLAAERIVRLDPMWARGHCMVGWIQESMGNWEAALESWERARSVHEETGQWGAWCSWSLAKLYVASGREAKAESLIAGDEMWQFRREDVRRGWDSGGLKGMSLALADLTMREGWPSYPWASCHYHFLGTAGALDRMFRCLDKEMDETEIDDPVADFSGTTRRLLLAQFFRLTLDKPYREDPRFRSLVRRLDHRIEEAAGTYERRVGLEILPLGDIATTSAKGRNSPL